MHPGLQTRDKDEITMPPSMAYVSCSGLLGASPSSCVSGLRLLNSATSDLWLDSPGTGEAGASPYGISWAPSSWSSSDAGGSG